MTDATQGDRALEFVDRYVAFLTGDGDEPELDALDEPYRSQALRQLRSLDLLNELGQSSMPPIEDDAIARRFGFDRPNPTITLSTAALKEAAETAGMQFSELARKLTAGGYPTDSRDLLRLTSGATAEINRDLVARFAAILRTSVSGLATTRHSQATLTLDEYLVLEETRSTIESVARELTAPYEDVQRSARELLGAAAFRNQTDESWRDALLAVLERIRHERRR